MKRFTVVFSMLMVISTVETAWDWSMFAQKKEKPFTLSAAPEQSRTVFKNQYRAYSDSMKVLKRKPISFQEWKQKRGRQ